MIFVHSVKSPSTLYLDNVVSWAKKNCKSYIGNNFRDLEIRSPITTVDLLFTDEQDICLILLKFAGKR